MRKRKSKIVFFELLIIVYVLVNYATLTQSFFDRTGFQFPASKFYQVDIGLNNVNGIVAAFGDFNADKYTDLFVIQRNHSQLDVYLWHADKLTYVVNENAKIQTDHFLITNVVPVDINYDGMLDLIVMGRNISSTSINSIELKIYLGNLTHFTYHEYSLPEFIGQPMVFDWDGDMRVDVLGMSATDGLMLLENKSKENRIEFLSRSLKNGINGIVMCDWAVPHSNAFVDMDGDCLADLIVVCANQSIHPSTTTASSVQLWLNRKKEGFKFHSESNLPKGTGQLSFADMDADGTIDVVFPVCYPQSDCSQEHSIHVVFNQQIPACSMIPAQQGSCRNMFDLCSSDNNFKLNFENISAESAHLSIPISQFIDIKERIVLFHADWMNMGHNDDLLPVPIRVTDYDLDGRPDLLISIKDDDGGRLLLLQNLICHDGKDKYCVRFEKEEKLNHIERITTEENRELRPRSEELNITKNTFLGASFDLNEDGTVDIIAMSTSNDGKTIKIYALYNSLFNDAFFMKIFMSNGACPLWCKINEHLFKPFGTALPGASFKYTVTEWTGKKRIIEGVQSPQMSYLSLQTHYKLFGLGRTNNYVEELYAGSSQHQAVHFRKWICIIPNSQLVVAPYQSSLDNPSSWSLDLYISPSQYISGVFIVFLSTMIVLSVIVFIFKQMEWKEDEKEKKDTSHRINFYAL